MKIAYIQCNDKDLGLDYCGDAPYVLVFENEAIGSHYCSNRDFANHDLTIWQLETLERYSIDKVMSNNVEVWSKKDSVINEQTNDKFENANTTYEAKYCN